MHPGLHEVVVLVIAFRPYQIISDTSFTIEHNRSASLSQDNIMEELPKLHTYVYQDIKVEFKKDTHTQTWVTMNTYFNSNLS